MKISPRSLKAIEKAGFVIEELYFLDLRQFKEKYPELMTLPFEIIEKRYEYYEEKRINNVEECKRVQIN